MPIAPGALAELRAALAGAVDVEDGALGSVATDASGLPGAPDARVLPEGPDDLLALVRWARSHRVPITARGAGTSLDGESVPVRGGVVVDFGRWTKVLEIDPVDGVARVQPGVVNRSFDRALAVHGWEYPPNPGSGEVSTLGGNVATNASGPRSFRHGPTRAWVRGLGVVDGTGARWSAGGRVAKSSVGPDLVGALVGSEGTLALFEEIVVRLAPRPATRTGLVLGLPAGRPLGEFVGAVRAVLGPPLSAVEFADDATVAAIERTAAPKWPGERGVLMIEVEGSSAEEAEALGRLDGARGALGLTEDPRVYPDADRLWRIRGEAGPALQRARGPSLREDVAVPVRQLDALLAAIRELARRSDVPVHLFGHVGEGNLHPVFGVDPRSDRARELRAALCAATLRLGGTISGEHGIGATKSTWVPGQLGDSAIGVLRALKATLDPDGVLNPGKLLP